MIIHDIIHSSVSPIEHWQSKELITADNFKPDSIDYTIDGQFQVKSDHNVRLDMPSQQGDVHTFSGPQQAAKDVECILIYDEETQTYTLEKLDSVVRLSVHRNAGGRTAALSRVPRSNASSVEGSPQSFIEERHDPPSPMSLTAAVETSNQKTSERNRTVSPPTSTAASEAVNTIPIPVAKVTTPTNAATSPTPSATPNGTPARPRTASKPIRRLPPSTKVEDVKGSAVIEPVKATTPQPNHPSSADNSPRAIQEPSKAAVKSTAPTQSTARSNKTKPVSSIVNVGSSSSSSSGSDSSDSSGSGESDEEDDDDDDLDDFANELNESLVDAPPPSASKGRRKSVSGTSKKASGGPMSLSRMLGDDTNRKDDDVVSSSDED